MIGYMMRSLLLILIIALVNVNSQARTLTEHGDKVKVNYGKPSKPPPPAPSSAPPTREVSPLLLQSWNNYGRPRKPSPPPPKPSTPVIQIITCCTTGPSEQNKFWTLKNYGKTARPPPPAPKLPPPIHQVSVGGLAASEKSSPNLFLSSA
ncbi:hypothetical protein Pfo_020150 [Paulownia fortunei]|nr:hypothetical protein Pfo_020150 [Paulownia fortunei]